MGAMDGFMKLAMPKYLVPKTKPSLIVSHMPKFQNESYQDRSKYSLANLTEANNKVQASANKRAIAAIAPLGEKFTRQEMVNNGVNNKNATNYIRRLIALDLVTQVASGRYTAVYQKVTHYDN